MGRTAKIIIWSVVTLTVLAITLTLFLIPGFSLGKISINLPVFSSYKYENADKYVAGDISYKTDKINRIDVSWVSGEVNIEVWDGDEISVSEAGNTNGDEEQKVHSAIIDGTLMIKFAASGKIKTNMSGKQLTVKVPAKAKLSVTEVDAVSADVSIGAGLGSDVLSVESVSGGITVKKFSGSEIDVGSTSGNIKIDSASVVKAEVGSVSGDVRINDSDVVSLDVETVSGEIYYSAASAKTMKSIDAESVSGDIKILLPEDAGFEAKLSSVSGDFDTDFACVRKDKTYTCGDGGIKISADTTSGDLTVNKK